MISEGAVGWSIRDDGEAIAKIMSACCLVASLALSLQIMRADITIDISLAIRDIRRWLNSLGW